MQPMAQGMRLGITPRNDFTIKPNATITIIKWNQCHALLPKRMILAEFWTNEWFHFGHFMLFLEYVNYISLTFIIGQHG
jgi:hypothetical protein